MFKKPLKVYFAGKITKNGWRQELIDLRSEVFWALNQDNLAFETLVQNGIEIDNSFIYNGPYMFGCDHGCFHGKESHGLGANINYECGGFQPLQPKDIFELCKTLVKSSDVVFCYLDEMDAYGTIWELSWAHAHNIPVYLYYSDQLRLRDVNDLWFVRMGCEVEQQVANPEEAFEYFKVAMYETHVESSYALPTPSEVVSPLNQHLCTQRQQNYLIGLYESTTELLNILKGTPEDSIPPLPLPTLQALTKGEAGKCIAILKAFVENGESLTSRRRRGNILSVTRIMKIEDFIYLFSLEQEAELMTARTIFSELIPCELPEIFQQHRDYRKKGRPIPKEKLRQCERTLERSPSSEKTDPRVKVRNRSKETFVPFQYLEQRRHFTKKISDFLIEVMINEQGEALTPEILNDLDRHQLASDFLTSSHCLSSFNLSETNMTLLNDELARHIDETIPRIYAKYTLDLPRNPSYYDVDHEEFGLTLHF